MLACTDGSRAVRIHLILQLFELCHIHRIRILCAGCYGCNLTRNIVICITDRYGRFSRLPRRIRIRRLCLCARIIPNGSSRHSSLRFAAQCNTTLYGYIRIMSDSNRIINRCRSLAVCGTDENCMVGIFHLTIIPHHKTVLRISHRIFRPYYGRIRHLIRRIVKARQHGIRTFIVLGASQCIIDTHKCRAKCIIRLITATKCHSRTATIRIFDSRT